MSIKKELGKKIKRIRILRGYTQEKLSELADISINRQLKLNKSDNEIEKFNFAFNKVGNCSILSVRQFKLKR